MRTLCIIAILIAGVLPSWSQCLDELEYPLFTSEPFAPMLSIAPTVDPLRFVLTIHSDYSIYLRSFEVVVQGDGLDGYVTVAGLGISPQQKRQRMRARGNGLYRVMIPIELQVTAGYTTYDLTFNRRPFFLSVYDDYALLWSPTVNDPVAPVRFGTPLWGKSRPLRVK